VARPTKYTPELLEKANQYLEDWRTLGDMIPSHEALAMYLNLNRSTLYDWREHEDKAEFSNILDQILTMQHRELMNNGLSGDFNAAITKLALGKHGYSDKVDSSNKHAIDLSNKSESELEAIIASAKS